MQTDRSILQKQRLAFKMRAMANFREIPKIKLPDIPETRTLYPGTENDYWYKIKFPDNADITGCIYELDAGQVFSPHYHEFNTEQFCLLTPGAKIQVNTFDYETVINYPNSAFFNKKEAHAVTNLSGFKIELLVIWKPKMLGWDIDFLSKDTNLNTQ